MAIKRVSDCAMNTDKELYREPHDDHWGSYDDSIFVTTGGGIGIGVGGTVYVKPLKEWHKLAKAINDIAIVPPAESPKDEVVQDRVAWEREMKKLIDLIEYQNEVIADLRKLPDAPPEVKQDVRKTIEGILYRYGICIDCNPDTDIEVLSMDEAVTAIERLVLDREGI